jgi:serine/threonine-protein kinase
MNELVAALESDPGVRQRRLALGLAGALAIGAVAMGARHTGAPTKAPLCREGAQHWASIWAPGAAASPQRDAIHGAFAATGRLYAERAFFAATALLDQYVAGWLDMYRETCEATAVKGEQSTEVLDLRMACLNERVLGARAVIDTFAHADATVVENAISAVSGLPRLARCADVPLLRAVVKPPEDEKVRKRVADLRGDVARLVAERDAGHFVAAEQLAQAILPRVRETGYKPLLADTLNAAAQIGYSGRQPEIAPARFREAYIAALACGHDEAAITAALLIAEGLADTANRPGEARQWLDVARSLLERIGGNALLESWILLSEGVILEAEGRTREAVIVLQRSRAAKIRLLGEKAVDVLKSTIALSNAYLLAGQYEQARAEASAAVAGMTSLLGPDHPIVAAAVDNEAEALNGLRRFEEAAAAFQRSLDIMKVAGADPLDLAIVLTGFGIAQVGAGRPAAGVPLLEQALHLRTEKRDLPARLGETRFALARALWAQSTEHERARTLATAARADYAKVPNAATKIEQIDRWLAHPSAGL